MPVTKTAKRALRVSKRKEQINKRTISQLEVAIRTAKKKPNLDNVRKVSSLADRAAKKNIIHKNKAARIKSAISKLAKAPKTKKTSNKTKRSTKKKK